MDGELYTQDKVLKRFYDAYNGFMRDMQAINGKWEDIGADYFRDIVIGGTGVAAVTFHSAVETMEWKMEQILDRVNVLTGNNYTLYQP